MNYVSTADPEYPEYMRIEVKDQAEYDAMPNALTIRGKKYKKIVYTILNVAYYKETV